MVFDSGFLKNDSLGIYQFDFLFVFQHFLGYQTEHDDICGVCMIIVYISFGYIFLICLFISVWLISDVQKGVILSSCVFIIGMPMCIVGGKRFVSRSVNSSLTGSLERKCSSLSGEEFEVKQQKWYV